MPFIKPAPNKSLIDDLDLAGLSRCEWFVVFMDAEPFWWNRWLRDGFKHIMALQWDGYNWLMFNPRAGCTDVAVLSWSKPDLPLDIVSDRDAVILQIVSYRDTQRIRSVIPMLPTCVEQIKALLGIRAPFALTPWQFYRYLIGGKHGKQKIQAIRR